MARRKGLLDDLFDLLMKSPWWVGVIAAAGFWVAGSVYGAKPSADALQGALTPIIRLFFNFLAIMSLIAAAGAAIRQVSRRKLLDRQSDLESLKALSWREFEHLVGEAYRRQGFDVEETGGGGADGGIDLVLRGNRETVLVQCKQWRQRQVGVDKVRELFGVVTAERSDRGILVTTGTFTKEAISFKVGKPLMLVDGAALAELVRTVRSPSARTSAYTAAPSKPAVRPSSSEPACPKCGAPMALRTAKRGANAGSSFYGCTLYPDCRGIREAG